jgi:hypothetical protein
MPSPKPHPHRVLPGISPSKAAITWSSAHEQALGLFPDGIIMAIMMFMDTWSLVQCGKRLPMISRTPSRLAPGDFFHVPQNTVHREINPSANEPGEVILFLLGGGPLVFNVEDADKS